MPGRSPQGDDLERLAQLRDRGIISEQEFEAETRQALDSVSGSVAKVERPSRPEPSRTLLEVDNESHQIPTGEVTQKPARREWWYLRKKGIVFAVLMLPNFIPYWLLTRRDTTDGWYTKRWGAALAVVFVPYFILWYIWARKTWSIFIKLVITVPLAFFLVVFNFALVTADYSGTNKDTVTPPTTQAI